jgi:hypothetical protein
MVRHAVPLLFFERVMEVARQYYEEEFLTAKDAKWREKDYALCANVEIGDPRVRDSPPLIVTLLWLIQDWLTDQR